MTTTTMPVPSVATRLDPAGLVEPELFGRLVRRIVADEHVDAAHAVRVVRQALAFLKACADNPSAALSPSLPVDTGWHAFILHTRAYAAFCDQIAGRFIHHTPDETGEGGASLDITMQAIEAAGFELDDELWSAPEARCSKCKKCHQCHRGCHDSP